MRNARTRKLRIGVWDTDLAYRSRLMAWAKNANCREWKWAEDIPRDEMVLLNTLWRKGWLWEFWKHFPLYARPDLLEWAWQMKRKDAAAGKGGVAAPEPEGDES